MLNPVFVFFFLYSVLGFVIILLVIELLKDGSSKFIFPQQRYPLEIEVSKEDADKAAWVCQEGIKRLTGWRKTKEIKIKFCRSETMPQQGQVLGCVFFEIPDTMFINVAYISQSWLIAKGVLHELYHIYQIDTLGATNDVDDSVNAWSDKTLDEILFAKYYKETGKNIRSYLANMKFPTVKTNKYVGVKCEK